MSGDLGRYIYAMTYEQFWVYGIVSLGSLRCSWYVGSASVALTVDSASSRLLFGRCLSPLCSLACMVVAFNMYMRVCPSGVVHFSSIGVHSFTLFSQKGAMRLSSLSQYLSGWHWFRSCLAQSFGRRFSGMCSRRLALISTTSFMDIIMRVATWLVACMLVMCSSSAPRKFQM